MPFPVAVVLVVAFVILCVEVGEWLHYRYRPSKVKHKIGIAKITQHWEEETQNNDTNRAGGGP
jgi:hypothetical protein